jgi:hypothetical protein
MKMAVAHRILITTAIVGALVFAAWNAWMYGTVQGQEHLLAAILSGSVGTGGLLYLKHFIATMRERGEL